MTDLAVVDVIPEWDLTDRLMKARRVAGLKQKELAERTGISLRSVVGYETGRTSPRRPQIVIWAMACGVSVAWLESGEGLPDGGQAADTQEVPGDASREYVDWRTLAATA